MEKFSILNDYIKLNNYKNETSMGHSERREGVTELLTVEASYRRATPGQCSTVSLQPPKQSQPGSTYKEGKKKCQNLTLKTSKSFSKNSMKFTKKIQITNISKKQTVTTDYKRQQSIRHMKMLKNSTNLKVGLDKIQQFFERHKLPGITEGEIHSPIVLSTLMN